jgi:hypothetical protein
MKLINLLGVIVNRPKMGVNHGGKEPVQYDIVGANEQSLHEIIRRS